MAAPSILLVDDGELDRVEALAQKLGLDCVRRMGPECDSPLVRPRDLLVTSGPRAMRMPELQGESDPVWVCIYDQDFLPLRDRLRALGIHYLVSGGLEARAFELFLHQLLHGGNDQRAERRIPLRAELEVEVGFERRKAMLVELSNESCVFVTAEEIHAERRVIVRLPSQLTGHEPIDLEGRVVRTSGRADAAPGGAADSGGFTTVLRFKELEADALARIHDVLGGHAPGTQVTPLSPEPRALSGEVWDGDEIVRTGGLEAFENALERRFEERRPFGNRVDAIRWPGQSSPRTALGRDLSMTGVRIALEPQPEIGTEISLALYAGAGREEPLLIEARVVRCEEGEVALAFGELTPDQRRRLAGLLDAKPQLERLGAERGAVHVAELVVR